MQKNYIRPSARICLLVLLSFVFPALVKAQTFPSKNKPLIVNNPKANDRLASVGKKVPSELINLKEEYQAYLSGTSKSATGRRIDTIPVVFKSSNKLIEVVDGYVIIDAVAEKDPQALAAKLKGLGAKNINVFGKVVSGLFPIKATDKMKELKELRFVSPSYRMVKSIGAITSQGDKAQHSDLARLNNHVNGLGSTVGILSDSYNKLGSANKGVLSGDLPGKGNPNGFTSPVNVLLEGNGIDEGRGMAEIVHDVAPGAKLAFNTAGPGQAGFARGILNLANTANADVVVDDVIYFAEPFFQDGIVAKAVDSVHAQGVTYFSAAGNQARESYEAKYKNTAVNDSTNYHDFGNGDNLQTFKLLPGGYVIFDFQWSDPFYSVSGGDGAATDLDVLILNRDYNVVMGAFSANLGNNPYEIFDFENDSEDSIFYLLIQKYAGPDPQRIKYVTFDGPIEILTFATNSGTIFGHANAAGAIATGAARYDRTPAFGVNPPRRESFSSAGGVAIYFDKEGNAISPILRKKPEIVAPDGGNTTDFPPPAIFGPGVDYEGDGFPNFFGTSAAAPHAAAVAALMREATAKTITPDKILQVLEKNALNMDVPGFDFNTGYGLINANKSVTEVLKPSIKSFVLINSATQKHILTLTDGMEVNLAALPTQKLNIRAFASPQVVGSVVFWLNGKKVIENYIAYDYAGSLGVVDLKVGNYTLTATPYSLANGGGSKGESLTIRFSVVNQGVTSFVLFNAVSGKVLGTIHEGDELNLATLPAKLNIRALTAPTIVGSVLFNLNGKKATENHYYYDFAGSGGVVDLQPGDYKLSATTYSIDWGRGIKGGSLAVKFKVINSSAPMLAQARQDFEGGNLLSSFPNPFSSKVTVRFRLAETENANLSVYDIRGALIAPMHTGLAEGGIEYEYELDGTGLQQGLYISRLVTNNGVLHQKMILNR
ncbi:MAG: S8 family serine peptidase [Bacteroidota bacterium]